MQRHDERSPSRWSTEVLLGNPVKTEFSDAIGVVVNLTAKNPALPLRSLSKVRQFSWARQFNPMRLSAGAKRHGVGCAMRCSFRLSLLPSRLRPTRTPFWPSHALEKHFSAGW